MRNLIVSLALALATTVYMGCSSNGDDGGGDGEKQALSLNAETALPAAGGAAISTDFGTRIAATLSAVSQALVEDSSDASSAVRLKGNFDAFCLGGGSADFLGLPIVDQTATLTLEECAGSPLSSTAVSGELVLVITAVEGTGPEATSISATASFAGLEDDGAFTIASGIEGEPNTELTGSFVTTIAGTPKILGADLLEVTLGDLLGTDLIEVSEGTRSLQVGCFKIETRINNTTSSIEVYRPVGVLSLNERDTTDVVSSQVYTLNRYSEEPPNIDFPAGSSVPSGGTLALYSGDNSPGDGCAEFAGVRAGDNSRATAEFMSEGKVSIDVDYGDDRCSLCTTTWENLLNTLSEVASPDSCEPPFDCGGSGEPVIDYVTWEWANCVVFEPDATVNLTVVASGLEPLTYTGSAMDCVPSPFVVAEPQLTCGNFTLTFGSVTVTNSLGSDTLTFEWESLCNNGCEYGTDVGEDACDDFLAPD